MELDISLKERFICRAILLMRLDESRLQRRSFAKANPKLGAWELPLRTDLGEKLV
jgi:hypothetical protein